MPQRTIRIALLLCDTPLPLVRTELGFDTYLPIFTSHLQDTLLSFPDPLAVEGVSLEVEGFDVVTKGEYPEDRKLRDGWYDAVMMTGSAHSAYAPLPWLTTLIEYIHQLLTFPPNPSIKIIGICFGMQVIGMAMAMRLPSGPGGASSGEDTNANVNGREEEDEEATTAEGRAQGVVPNPEGWEIGVYEVGLTGAGRDWVGRVRVGGKGEEKGKREEEVEIVDKVVETRTIHIQQMHRDHLPFVPRDFELLGSSPRCKVQGIVRYDPRTGAEGLTSGGKKKIRVLGLQGHPEFTSPIVDRMIRVRSSGGIIDRSTTEEAMRRSGMKEGGEGRGVVGWGLWAVLLDL